MISAVQDSQRQIILDAIHHLDHVLPGQAPIHDFVHHNTLHGYQHLPFEQALDEFTNLTGIQCYLPEAQFRVLYTQGRINEAELEHALRQRFADVLQASAGTAGKKTITRQQLYRLALLEDLTTLTPAEWHWRIQESGALQQENDKNLWQALTETLDICQPVLHPEQMLDLSDEQAHGWLPNVQSSLSAEQSAQTLAELDSLFDSVGDRLTLGGLVKALTGIEVMDNVRPLLIRWCGSLLDEGLAAWCLPERQYLGLYGAWLQIVQLDATALFQDLLEWDAIASQLPGDAVDAIIQQLQAMAVPECAWEGYLHRLALELPGWSGLINWRQTHPHYQADDASQALLADYLAVRLILDRVYLQTVCREQWHCPAQLLKLKTYFRKNSAEFSVRYAMFKGELPEYLQQAGRSILAAGLANTSAWQVLAERIWTWQHSPLSGLNLEISLNNHAWRLYLTCQNLGLSPAEVRQAGKSSLLAWLAIIDEFDDSQRQSVWLNAYEQHYRQELLQGLHANHARGRWLRREIRPQAQIYFCMDEREESFRRHLEELNPAIETLGVAGFFGIPMYYRGLDAHHDTPLCPVVVSPAHRVIEEVQPGQEHHLTAHKKGLRQADGLAYQLYQTLRRSPFWAYPLQYLLAPVQLGRLLGKTLWPNWQRRIERRWLQWLVPAVATQLHFIAETDAHATSEQPRLGFTDQEQTQRVAQFLRTTGLTQGFAPIVALMGHGSTSQNNPHEAAHDCGACGGRQGGPNARAFAAMANRPIVRQLLLVQGINIPHDTWFVGAQHDTCSDMITWFDLDRIPDERQADFAAFQACVLKADGLAAAERCRRFVSSGRPKSAHAAIKHVENRALDLSQVRPEFGHATNAAALIGRRAASQGVFFDRRLFLISYDASQDPEGSILENILLTAGPVGAGISLEYYFSSVNNERLGCGTKIPHNVTGMFGVMEGASSDLRTGLPLQMVEIHEAMRLQIVVEAKTEILARIYARQPALQELIGGGWVHLIAMDPADGRISLFQRDIGFVPWQPPGVELPLRADSADCYRDETGPVSTMLIEQPLFEGVPC